MRVSILDLLHGILYFCTSHFLHSNPMQRPIFHFVLIAVAFLIFRPTELLSLDKKAAKGGTAESGGRPDSLKVGDSAPTFVLRNIATGDPVFLRDFSGKSLRRAAKNQPRQAVVLSFWATWCEPCKKEIPILSKIADDFKDKPVKFFLVNTLEQANEPTFTEDSVNAVLKSRHYSIPCLVDATGRIADSYQIRALPVIVVIDKDGNIRKISRGFDDGFEISMPVLLNELIK